MGQQYTKAQRQEIIREFAVRHNGQYNPKLFIEEVQSQGSAHPAYEWFEWDDDTAAREHRLWQAREFAKNLRISFTVEEVGRSNVIRLRQTEAPLVLSPVEGRSDGGGYHLFDPNNPEHVAEHCSQAAKSLRSWLNRHESALLFAQGNVASVQRQILILETFASIEQIEAAE